MCKSVREVLGGFKNELGYAARQPTASFCRRNSGAFIPSSSILLWVRLIRGDTVTWTVSSANLILKSHERSVASVLLVVTLSPGEVHRILMEENEIEHFWRAVLGSFQKLFVVAEGCAGFTFPVIKIWWKYQKLCYSNSVCRIWFTCKSKSEHTT